MKADDQRVQRTRRALAQALIDLTLEQGYEAVTIRALTRRAGVGYATFFRHYDDKQALLRDVLDVVLEELLPLLDPPADAAGGVAVGEQLYRYVAARRALCRVLLGPGDASGLVQRMIEVGAQRVLAQYAPRPDSVVPPEVAAQHLAASSIALLRWWLEHDMPYPPERLGEIAQRLIMAPALDAAFLRPALP